MSHPDTTDEHIILEDDTFDTGPLRVWFQRPNIVTRNSDGGVSGWSIKQASELHHRLGEMLAKHEATRERLKAWEQGKAK